MVCYNKFIDLLYKYVDRIPKFSDLITNTSNGLEDDVFILYLLAIIFIKI